MAHNKQCHLWQACTAQTLNPTPPGRGRAQHPGEGGRVSVDQEGLREQQGRLKGVAPVHGSHHEPAHVQLRLHIRSRSHMWAGWLAAGTHTGALCVAEATRATATSMHTCLLQDGSHLCQRSSCFSCVLLLFCHLAGC